MSKKRIFLVGFITMGVLNIGGQILELELLTPLSKALIIPLLAAYVYSSDSPSKIYLFALFFSWLGDLLLILDGQLYFILGIAAFWVTQFLYCKIMLKDLNGNLKLQLNKKIARIPLVVLGSYLLAMLTVMLPGLGVLQVPVSLYAVTLSTTGFLGVLTAIEKKSPSTTFLALGCILFVISDSMIAFDAFYFDKKIFTYWVMATYIPAQFFISKHLGRST